MNTEDIMEEVFNVNYMDMYTQSSDSKIEDSETNEEEEISNHPSMIKYILACLCQHINFTQYHTIVKNEDISKHIKAPYVLCNDNPTLNSFCINIEIDSEKYELIYWVQKRSVSVYQGTECTLCGYDKYHSDMAVKIMKERIKRLFNNADEETKRIPEELMREW